MNGLKLSYLFKKNLTVLRLLNGRGHLGCYFCTSALGTLHSCHLKMTLPFYTDPDHTFLWQMEMFLDKAYPAFTLFHHESGRPVMPQCCVTRLPLCTVGIRKWRNRLRWLWRRYHSDSLPRTQCEVRVITKAFSPVG